MTLRNIRIFQSMKISINICYNDIIKKLKKYEKQGGKNKPKEILEPSMVKQIAGRAGRRSSQYKGQGMATCLDSEDMDYLHKAMAAPVVQVSKAGLFPPVEFLDRFNNLLEKFDDAEEKKESENKKQEEGEEEDGDLEGENNADALSVSDGTKKKMKISEVVTRFLQTTRLRPDANYFITNSDDVKGVADKLHPYIGQLPLIHAFPFCQAPVNVTDQMIATFIKKFAETWALNKPTGLNLS
jgi:hypothetical protein